MDIILPVSLTAAAAAAIINLWLSVRVGQMRRGNLHLGVGAAEDTRGVPGEAGAPAWGHESPVHRPILYGGELWKLLNDVDFVAQAAQLMGQLPPQRVGCDLLPRCGRIVPTIHQRHAHAPCYRAPHRPR